MLYLDVIWKHDDEDEPIRIFSEIDENGYEHRKVEVYRDGKIGYAFAEVEHQGTRLSPEAIPPLEEINRDSQFEAVVIEKADFEKHWAHFVPKH